MSNPNKTIEVISTVQSFIIDNWLLAIVLLFVSIFVYFINNKFRLFSKAIQDANLDPEFKRLIDFIINTNIDSCNDSLRVFSFGIFMLVIEDGNRSSLGEILTKEQAIEMAKRPNFFGGITFFVTVLLFILQLRSFRGILKNLQDFKRKIENSSQNHHFPVN
jgi:hypothetical protein